jgi:hypothetical protein
MRTWAGVVALIAIPLGAWAPSGAGARQAHQLLPDLMQTAPSDLSVAAVQTSAGTRYQLGFTTTIENRGRGPLRIAGDRAGRARPVMSVSQHVKLRDGRWRWYRHRGVLRYAAAGDHHHWHLLGFDRYELRASGGRVLSAHKLGFCLGDRIRVSAVEADQPLRSLDPRCGRGRPGLLRLGEAISAGWADIYPAHIEGQYFDVTGLLPGRFRLTQTVNPLRRLVEARYANNVAWADIEIGAPPVDGSGPPVRLIASCGAPFRC